MKTFLKRLVAIGLGLGISLAGVSTAFAADLNYNANTNVSIGGNTYTILSGSAATSVIVGASTLKVTVPSGSAFTLQSTDRYTLANDRSVANSCTSTYNQLEIVGSVVSAEVTITPSTTLCSITTGGGGGGGGGGGVVTPPVVPPVVEPPVTAHGPGSVVKTSDGTVWFITNSNPVQRRAFTSGGAFLSYGFLSFSQVVDANSADLALTTGSFIAPRDGSVFCATATKDTDVKGECALITNSQKAAFTSGAVFTGLGFKFSNVQYGDSSFLSKTTNIATVSEAHRTGVLVNNAGTIQLVGNATLVGIPSMDIFSGWGYTLAGVVPANQFDKSLPQSGVMIGRVAGQLNPVQ